MLVMCCCSHHTVMPSMSPLKKVQMTSERGLSCLQHAAEVLLLLLVLRDQRWCVPGKVPTDVHPAELDLLEPYK